MQSVAAGGDLVTLEYRFRHKDGSWQLLESTGRGLLGDPLIAGIVVNSRDITERRRVEEQLRQARKVEGIGQLTAGIVHGFNNALSVILSNAELIPSELPPDAESRADLDDLTFAAQSGAAMVRKLLAFGRQAALNIAPLDLSRAVADLAAMLRRILPSRVTLNAEVGEGLLFVLADDGAVQQILLNLATNARDAMPDGGTLGVEVARETIEPNAKAAGPDLAAGDYVRVTVRDTGAGMDAATQERIFEPFFTTKPPGQGTGLGLPMVNTLVRQHHGAVAVVVVDDQESLRRTIRRILEPLGYAVTSVADGQAALEWLESADGGVELVVSDVDMPRLDGPGLYRELRRRGNRVRFILSTGCATAHVEGVDAQDVFVLPKPWTADEVARTARAALDAP